MRQSGERTWCLGSCWLLVRLEDHTVVKEVGIGVVALDQQHFRDVSATWPAFNVDHYIKRIRDVRLYGISAIYDRSFTEIASYFGLRMADLGRDRAAIGVPRTHLVDREGDAEGQSVSLPVEFKPEFRFENTNLLSRVVEKWDEVPIGLLQHLDLRKSMYGYIGLEDHTLYPLIRPGSLVQIDPGQRKISSAPWRTEFERPIYFVELRNAYLCSWCQLEKGQLMVIPHPQSRQTVRHFEYPAQAEIVGRVTGVAMRIVDEE
jgi:hypothetical protein